ncbi:MAG TPA: AbrB/MazE/SpoVT family DNA-binding domain-containing protein [Terriglobales bacterium]|nr:AbrB/MazE/SpoVT family DNA-binding domain-containing protein [Terriglobales bacterium]
MATPAPERHTAQVDATGRLLIPAALRRQCGLAPGTAVTLVAGGEGELVVQSRQAAVREAQAYFQRLRRPGQRWSDELIAERRREARREYGR